MAVNIKLKRSAQSGKIPTTSSLELGEIALNTFDGRAFMKIQNNVTTSVVEFATTAGSGSSVVSASYALTASFASYAANAGNALTANFATSASYALNSTSASYAQTSSYAGNFNVSGNLVVGGAITAQTLHVQTITSSIIYSSGSNIFGDSTADTQTLNGTVSVSGSFNVTGSATINNLTGSLFGTASWALNAISSSYANNATTASYALNATSASYANNATSASYANDATSASYAANATTASYALNATSASYANNATTASYALDATSASYAGNATTASYALNSTSASYASASTSASYAVNATTASYALNSELLDGLDSTVFTLTSSFNTFTQSYYTDSASFNNRINSLTESVFTHVVTNSGASSYIIDGITKPILSFVPGATYRFNTSGVVGTHPFKFSTSPNGPTEYTTGVTSGSGYIQIEVNYDTPTTLYYYCTIHSGMGNEIDILRINTLNTGSFTGSFIGTFTGSFSGSLNNLQGTATYIPFFSSSQVLANSAMYQVGTASIAINETNITTANPEALYVFQTHPTSINVVTGKGNLNNYLQNNIQNTNQGVSASSDVVATANNGNETSFYIDMGINSENYNQGFVGAANDAYLYSAANHLHIGNITPNQPIQFFAGGPDSDANRKFQLNSNNLHQMTGSLDISGSLTVRNLINGTLIGTASWALNAISSSYTNNATSASYAANATSASYALNATTASYALNSTSASYALNATSASYASASTSASYALNAVTASYALNATSASYALNATSASYASASTSASYALNSTTASYALDATSASYAANSTTASYSLNTTSASYALNATSASYAVTAAYASNVPATASYAISASHADTASYVNPLTQSVQITGSLGVTGSVSITGSGVVVSANVDTMIFTGSYFQSGSAIINGDITATGTITAQQLNVQVITSSVEFVTGSTRFGSLLSNTHQFTGSVSITGSLDVNNSSVITSNQTGSMSVLSSSYALTASFSNNSTSASYAATASFVTNAQTASFVLNAVSASYASGSTSASYALNATSASYASGSTSASYALNATSASYASGSTSASYALNATSASYSNNSVSASYALNATSASYASGSTSASYALDATTASYALNTTSASYALNATSASYALTASFVTNAQTASYVLNAVSASYASGSTSASYALNATSASYAVNSTSASYSLVATSASYASGSTSASYANNAVSASFASNATSASYSNNSTSASYALTASFALNGGGGGLSALYIQDEGSTQGTASYIDFTGAGVTATVTNGTASIVIPGGGGGSAVQGASVTFSQPTASTTWSINHAINSRTPVVEVYDSNYNVIIPTGIYNPAVFQTEIYFEVSQSGFAIISTGGVLSVSGSNAILNQTTASTTWSFSHELNNLYPVFTIFDSNDDVIIPQRIHVVDTSSALIYFSSPRTGTAVASIAGNQSFATSSLSASYAAFATSASYSLVATSASYSNNATTASYSLVATSASYAANADLLDGKDSTIFATTGSNIFKGNQTIFGNLFMSGSFPLIYNNEATSNMLFGMFDGSSIYGPYYQLFGNQYANVSQRGGAEFIYDIRNNSDANFHISSFNGSTWTQKFLVNDAGAQITGSLIVTNGITGSLQGTASWAVNALTASFVANAQTASYVLNAVSASYANNATNADTASFVTLAQTASFVTTAQTASFVQNAQTASFVTTAQTASFVQNAQTASYVLNAISASYANNATTADTASFVTLAQTASFVTLAQTASFVTTAQTASFVQNAQTASYVENAQTASYVLNAVSASYAASASNAVIASTASSADSFLVRGTLTAQTLVVQTVTSSVVYSSGSNIFGNDLTNTQILTGSVTVTGSLAVNGSNVILTNQTSSMSVATASFVANAQTASYVLNAVSASYANNATTADTASFVTLAQTASFVTTAQTASFVQNAQTASFVTTAQTASYVLNAVSSSYSLVATSASYASNATSASYSSNSTSASYALTASFALNGGGGGISAIYIADEGTLQGTASYFDFTGAGVTATVSAGTASINITGGGGGGTSGLSTFFTQSVAAVTWSFTHNLNTRTPLVQVYDTSYNQIQPQYVSASNGSTVEIGFGIATAGFAVASTGGTLYVTGSNVILDQTVAAATWSFTHNLNTQYPIFQVFNSSNEVMIPEVIKAVDTASALIYFPTPVTGKAVASLGGLSGSFTASYALNANTASYALTSSYSLSGTGFPYSGSAVITGSFLVSQSFVDFSRASYVTGSFTGSLLGTASYATQALTASYATFALTASTAPGYTVQFSQSVAATTWSFTHNMNTRNPIVQVYDTNYKQIIPNDIVGTGVNTAEVRFDYAQAGYVVMSNGGGLYVTGSTSELIQTVGATTWSFTHNLNSKYVNFTVYDSNDFVIIPANIKAIDVNSAELYFATSQTGRAVAQFSGINGAPNATTASYALTASYASTFAIDQSLMDYASVNSSIVGSNNLFTQATGSYTSAFIQYTCASGSNSRAGRIMAVWNGGTIEFNDVSTADIGSTTAVTSSLSLVGTDVQFNVQTNTSGWRIKSTATFM